MQNYGLEQKVSGKPLMEYMADLIDRNEKAELEIERVKNSNNTLKQMHNHVNAIMNAEKIELKKRELSIREKEIELISNGISVKQ